MGDRTHAGHEAHILSLLPDSRTQLPEKSAKALRYLYSGVTMETVPRPPAPLICLQSFSNHPYGKVSRGRHADQELILAVLLCRVAALPGMAVKQNDLKLQ